MRSWSKTIVAICSIMGIIILLKYIGWLAPFEFLLARSSTTISRILYTSQIYVSPGYNVSSVQELIEAYVESEENLVRVTQDIGARDLLETENNILREQLNFISTHGYNTVGADVIGKQIDPTESTLLINRGSLAGIELHMPVIVGNGALIGKIAKVEEERSFVRLIHDSQSSIAATINNEELSIGVVEGGFGITLEMNLIPQNERIQPNDIVLTSGLSNDMPRGLLIGTVDSVEKEAYEPFQSAIIRPAVQADHIQTVSVILSKQQL